jgi:hypothetical protein
MPVESAETRNSTGSIGIDSQEAMGVDQKGIDGPTADNNTPV